MKTLVTLMLLAMVLTVVGCKASGEIDTDTQTSITQPR
jgi:hypothetical protein